MRYECLSMMNSKQREMSESVFQIHTKKDRDRDRKRDRKREREKRAFKIDQYPFFLEQENYKDQVFWTYL